MLWNHWRASRRIQVFLTQGYECCAIRLHKDADTVIMPPSKGPLILRKTMDLWMVSRANGTVSKHPGSMALRSRRGGEIWSPLFTFLTLSVCNQKNPNYFQNCIFKGLWETFLAFLLLKSRKVVKKLSESICNIQYKR